MPDLFLYNGKLHTQDMECPQASAVLIRNGRILASGGDEVGELAGNNVRRIDLAGRRVLPGLVDAHFHLHDWALGWQRIELSGVGSLRALLQRLDKRARHAMPRDWVLGQGWNETTWPENRLPNRQDLDEIAPSNPVLLWRSDMHMAVANSAALHAARINAATQDPPEGVIDRDSTGQPTGVLRELAINLIRAVIPRPSDGQLVDALHLAFPELHRLGLTGLHDFRIMGGEEGPPAFRAYQQLLAKDELNLRIWMNLPGEKVDEAIALGLRSGFGCDRLRIGHVKLFSDGSQGSRTAWMVEPYQDTNQAGMPLRPMAEIADIVRRADQAGLAVAVHAIGDRANRELLDVFEEIPNRRDGEAGRIPAAPHRIEHVQNIRPEDVVRMGRLGLSASVQPVHVLDDYRMVEVSVGPRARWAYPFRDLIQNGVRLALGSDCPVADPNPILGIHAAVNRQRPEGDPPGGWYPEQRLTVAEAVWGYTMGPAKITGQEDRTGSITPGKLADLVVLDRDIFSIDPAEIYQAKPVMTVLAGEVVFESA